jgi:hypothetical protein
MWATTYTIFKLIQKSQMWVELEVAPIGSHISLSQIRSGKISTPRNSICHNIIWLLPTVHSNNIHWQCFIRISLIFQAESTNIQESIRYNPSTLHDIFPAPLNMVAQLNVMVTSCFKVCGCHSIPFLNQTHVFDWCGFRWGAKNKHHKVTCLKKIGLLVFKLF